MSRRTFRFDGQPLDRDVTVNGKHLRFRIVEGEAGGKGNYATVWLFNGRVREDGQPDPLHTDRMLVDSEVARRRFLKAAVAADPTLDGPDLGQELVRLSVDFAARLAVEATTPTPTAPPADLDALRHLAGDLLTAPDLLDRVVQAMESRGLVRETANAKLGYLAATTRLRQKPLSLVVKGPSSSGKNFLLERVTEMLPPDQCVNFTAVSPKFLAYSDLDLRHKIVLIFEAGGMAEGEGAYIMRSLLSEGKLHMGTVDRDENGVLAARDVEKEGPTGLFTSTTAAGLEGELETRALPLATDDSAEQSRAIMRGVARAYTAKAATPIDLAPFHALQTWLALAGEHRVQIPYAGILAEGVSTAATRIRRDFPKLMELIAASAILHQEQRGRTADGAVLATQEDYRIVYELASEIFGAAQQDGLTRKQREAVIAVTVLQPEGNAGVSVYAVAERLGIDRSAASRRLANPLEKGYVRNLEERPKQPARYAPGEKMPEPITALPAPHALADRAEVAL